MPNIFISYRRDDSAGYAGRLYDQVSAHFGRENVFMDVTTIRPGTDFVDVIEESVGKCDALIALIGKNWLTSRDEQNQLRLGNADDFVSREIAAALRRKVEVIPILVGGAKMPLPRDLPESLQLLSRRQALEISDRHFARDVLDLISALEQPAKRQSSRQPPEQTQAQVDPDISGNWRAVVQTKGVTYEIYFTFEVLGDKLFGNAVYPTGEGGILNGTIAGGRISFTTKHVPQFEEKEALTTVEGKISGDEIQILTQTRDGYSKGVARRVARISPPTVLRS